MRSAYLAGSAKHALKSSRICLGIWTVACRKFLAEESDVSTSRDSKRSTHTSEVSSLLMGRWVDGRIARKAPLGAATRRKRCPADSAPVTPLTPNDHGTAVTEASRYVMR